MKWLLTIALFVALSGCSNQATKAECDKLLDHVVELEVVGKGKVSADMKADIETQKEAIRKDVEKRGFLKECRKTLPADQVRCAIKADSMEALAKCEGDE